MANSAAAAPIAAASVRTNFRWVICSLLFFATTVNYLDRQVLSLTWKDFIAPEFHWTDSDYGTITGFFSFFYAAVSLFAGKIIDKLGSRKGYLLAIFVWSLAACLHAGCGWLTMKIEGVESVAALTAVKQGSALALSIATVSVWLFLACRGLLALGEAGNFPAGEWIDCRVELEAKVMLRKSGLTIQEISLELNFSNQSFFGTPTNRWS